MSGTSSEVLNPPSLYSNLHLSLYLNVEPTDLLLEISASHPNSVFIRILAPHVLESPFFYIYLFIKYYLYF